MFRLGGILFAGACLLCAAAADPVRVWQDTITLPTYREKPPDALPPFDQFALTGTGLHAIYPYTLRRNMTAEKYDAAWRALHLENQYLHCLVLPDLGGRLYSCRDKLSGTDVFYTNTAIKKADMAPRGAWVAGGIESSFPVAHSRVSVSPVHFATTTSPDGSATLFISAVDRASGMEWRVAYTLHPGSAVLEQKVWLYNPGFVREPYQWWTNAAVRVPDSGLQFTFPMWVTVPHGPGVFDSWPVDTRGVDRSRSANYSESLGLFAYGSHEPFIAAYNPQSRTGISHWAGPREMPGKKIWVYGKNTQGYKDKLSDDHSAYAEIQAGLMTTQDMTEYLQPQQSRSFTELWIPSRNTAGISRATPDAVLYLQRVPAAGGKVKALVDLNVTKVLSHASLSVTKGGAVVLHQVADLDPATNLHAESEPVDPAGKFQVELKSESGQVLLAHLEDTYTAIAPGEVKIGAPLPSPAAQTALARAGEAELGRELDRAAIEYDTALKKSPGPALRKAAGIFYVKLNRFAEGSALLGPLQHDNLSDAEIAYYLAVAKSELDDDAGARPLWNAYLTDPRLGLASQYQLACASARAGDQKTALSMLHAIAAVGPGRAAGLEIALLRRMGHTSEAQAALQKALAADPTDSLLRVESVLLGHEDHALWAHLAADPEWVLDVVDEYFDAGLYRDAIALLERSYPAVGELQTEPGAVLPQDYPLIAYYRGYARLRLGESPAADFGKAATQSTLYVYPYRASSCRVLRAAIQQNPADATAHYLLGCLLFHSRATDQALSEWKLAKGSAARIPAFDQTVARAQVIAKNDAERAARLAEEARAAAKPADRVAHRPPAGNVPPARVSAPSAPPPSFRSPEDAAAFALNMLANRGTGAAEEVFQARNFPQAKQPQEVRQAYAELQLQNLLGAAQPGTCEDVSARIEDFTPERTNLPFTFYGFGEFAKQLRMQFYFGVAEWMCGDRKAAERRWRKIAKSKPPASADFAFPAVAASLLDSAGSQRAVESALETLRNSGGPSEKGLRAYSEGMLLRAAGRDRDAAARFREGAADSSPYIRYLNESAQKAPPLPR